MYNRIILSDIDGFNVKEVDSSFIASLCDRIEKIDKGNPKMITEITFDVIRCEVKMALIDKKQDGTALVDKPETIKKALITETGKVLHFVEGMGIDLFDYEREKRL